MGDSFLLWWIFWYWQVWRIDFGRNRQLYWGRRHNKLTCRGISTCKFWVIQQCRHSRVWVAPINERWGGTGCCWGIWPTGWDWEMSLQANCGTVSWGWRNRRLLRWPRRLQCLSRQSRESWLSSKGWVWRTRGWVQIEGCWCCGARSKGYRLMTRWLYGAGNISGSLSRHCTLFCATLS